MLSVRPTVMRVEMRASLGNEGAGLRCVFPEFSSVPLRFGDDCLAFIRKASASLRPASTSELFPAKKFNNA
jgi:hypothetical protein